MSVGYRLGLYSAGAAGLVYLEDLGLSVAPYPTPYRPWSFVYEVVNGATYGDGYAQCEWRFQWLKMTDMAILLGYIGAGNQSALVGLSTKDDTDAFLDRYAYMHRPEYPRQGDRSPGRYWRDVVFRFTQLQAW